MLLAAFALGACSTTGRTVPRVVRFVIPNGTEMRLIRGAHVQLMPERLHVHVGDRIEVENNDRFAHSMGPFFVKALSSYSLVYQAPGHFVGSCTFTPTGRYEIDVTS